MDRSKCEWPEVHFSRENKWIEYCNEVLWVMQQDQWKTDDENGRGRCAYRRGTRMEEGEAKEHAVEEGLKWAQKHAVAYEAQV